MNLLFAEKKVWFIYPIVLLILIGFLLLNKSIAYDVITFKREYYLYSTLFNVFILVSLSMIFFFDYWKKQKKYDKFLYFGLATLLISTNFVTNVPFQASVLFIIAVLNYVWNEKKIYRPDTFYVLVFIYFLVNTISLLWTNNISGGVALFKHLTPLAYLSILFCCFRLKDEDFDLLFLVLVRFSILYIFITVISWILQSRDFQIPLSEYFEFEKHAFGIYTAYDLVFAWTRQIHPTYNALPLLFSLTIAWLYIFKKNIKDNITIVEFIFLILGVLLIAIISNSRFMLLLFLAINFWGILFQLIKNIRLRQLIIVISIAISIVFSSKIIFYVQDPIRKAHYEATFQGIKENVFLGTGLGGMTKYINKDNPAYRPLGEHFRASFVHTHSHNQILGDWLQTGILGLSSILLILAYLLVYGIKNKDYFLLINYFILLLLMSIEMPLAHINGIFYFIVVYGLLIKRGHKEKILIKFAN